MLGPRATPFSAALVTEKRHAAVCFRRADGAVGVLLLVVAACSPSDESMYRGGKLSVATLTVSDAVGVYRATLGGSFTLGDPSLSILVDPTLLPRTPGLAGGNALSTDVLSAIRADGVVRGTCTVPVQKAREALVCPAERAGYAVRFSAPFAIGPDSVQVHMVAEQYAIPNGPRAERLRFERAYHVVRRGSEWRALREARLPQP